MADNVTANPGAGGPTFATDEVSSAHWPYSKLAWGPDGTANIVDVASGKPIPIQLRKSGGNEWGTIADPLIVVPQYTARTISGIYFGVAEVAVAASADSSTSGKLWLQNPSGSGKKAFIRKFLVSAPAAGIATTNVHTLFRLEHFTFTGTASGAEITPGKAKAAHGGTNAIKLRTAATGMSISAGNPFFPFYPGAANGATSGSAGTTAGPFEFSDDESVEIVEGAGVVLRQHDAGVTSDSRQMAILIVWDES